MSTWLVLFVPAATLVVVLGAVVWIFVAGRRLKPLIRARQQAIAATCAQRGLVPGLAATDFAILGAIDHRLLTNAFSSVDHTVAVADFMRPEGKQTQFFTLLAFRVAGLNVPYVAVTRRELGGITLGGPPAVELESIDFDDRFTVKAKDRRSAVMLLDPGMMQLLLDCIDVNFLISGDRALAYVNRAEEPAHRPADPVEFDVLFKFKDGFSNRVPALLRTEYSATQ